MKGSAKAVLLGVLLAATGASVALTLPHGGVPSLLDLTADRLPPPPQVRLLSPQDGEGVGARVVVAGVASGAARDVIDVQVRVDEGRWASVPEAPRGQRSVPFELALDLGAGDHVVEARAWDGEAYSLPARVEVRRDAPTLRILQPQEGAGVEAGPVLVSGSVVGRARGVVVEAAGSSVNATLLPGGAWSALLELPAGVHEVRARALAEVPSLPRVVRVAAGTPAPPALEVLAPEDRASYGEAGDLSCGGGCILFTGRAPGAARVAAVIDGVASGNASVLPTGAWTFRLPMVGLANGTHEAVFTPFDAGGQQGVPRAVRLLARTPLALSIVGDDDARPTHTLLRFTAQGEGVASARWTLGGAPVGTGPSATVSLGRAGDHVLGVQAVAPNGRAASASLALHAVNRAPDVALAATLDPLTGLVRLDAAGLDTDGAIVEHRWEFGDGRTGVTASSNITHRYPERGVYEANVTVVDDHGATARASAAVLVVNVAPLAAFSWSPAEPTVSDVVTFTQSSEDPDGRVVQRLWRFGENATSEDASPSLRFHARGDHPVTLTVVDDAGVSTSLTQIVRVRNLAPEPRFTHEPALPRTHEEVLFADASVDLDGPLASRRWDFGDGETATGAAVLHAYRAPGAYNVTLTVVDDAGATANATLRLLVADAEPTIRAVTVEPPQPRARDEVRFSVVASDREGSLVAFSWDFGDGVVKNESEPLHRYARSGHYHGRVSVVDEAGLSTTFPFTVLVENRPPTASLRVAEGGIAAYPTRLVVDASDLDGRVVLYRFDADGDGEVDCEATEPACLFTYGLPGAYGARAWVEDDEASVVEAQLAVDVSPPPSHLAPPTVTVESPVAHARVRGDYLFRGEAFGLRPIEKVELQVRNASWAYSGAREPWRLANGNASWTSLVDTRAFHDGEFTLVVRATDVAGGVGFARVPILVENGERTSDVSIRLVDAPEVVSGEAAVRGSAFHPEGVTSVRWRLDDEGWRVVTSSPLAFTIPLDARQLKPGEHVLRIEAYRGPAESANVTHVFRVPGQVPVLVVDEPPTPVQYGLLSAAGRIVGEGRAQWRLDHDVWRDLPPGPTWRLAEETQGILGGNHTLHIRAVSPDGRLASEPASWRVFVQNPWPAGPALRDEPPAPRAEVALPPVAALLALALAAWRRR